MIASKNGHIDVVKILIDSQENVDIQDNVSIVILNESVSYICISLYYCSVSHLLLLLFIAAINIRLAVLLYLTHV